MTAYDCNAADREEHAARYVAGRMMDEERANFELHLLSCTACRAGVERAVAIRAALMGSRRRRIRRLATVPGVAAAAALVFFIAQRDPVQRLGAVDLPAITGLVAVRAAQDSAADLAARAVAAYDNNRFLEAADLFARAYEHQPQTGTAYLLGVSLMAGEKVDSALALFRTITADESATYAGDAFYYSAKLWLQLNQPDSAEHQLQQALLIAGDRARAQALLDSLNAVR